MEQTELALINTMLIQIGESPVNEIDLTHPDIRAAQRIIDDLNTEIQSKVWWYNTETWELVPQLNGDVFIPGAATGILNTKSAYWVKRGRKLYDLERHSFDFSDEETITLDIITAWSIPELPPTVYVYLQQVCRKRMQVGFDFDGNKVIDLTEDIKVAYHNVQVQDLKFNAPNATSQAVARQVIQNFPTR